MSQPEPVHALQRGELAVQGCRGGAVLQAQALVPFDRSGRDVDRLRAGEHICELRQPDLFQVGEALPPIVAIIVDDEVLRSSNVTWLERTILPLSASETRFLRNSTAS